MLYSQSRSPKLSQELFRNPGSEYRGAPFWSWNCKLDKDILLEEIGHMKSMGMGGFHIHSRTGLATDFLGEEYISLYKNCHERATQENMLTWLYDEDRWPSGYGGGMVTQDERYRIRYLVFTPFKKNGRVKDSYTYNTRVAATSHGCGDLLAKYRISLEDGYLKEYERLKPDESTLPDENIWYAYLEIAPDNPWYNNQAYVNTLDENAIKKFIACIYEKFKTMLGSEFGKTVPAIFTDEPQMAYKNTLSFAEEKKDVSIPYTEECEGNFKSAYGVSLLDHLPELFWELGQNKKSRIRYYYHDLLCEMFTRATPDVIGNWCGQNRIYFTGHMMNESSLDLQTVSMGEAMRCYRSMHIPGIDMLCDKREFNTAKQAQSVARQYGREGVLSELYGVTNWDFDFRGHKLQGDWQAALGITVRVHHLNHVSLSGEAKRDYPASIGYQSPWYLKYSCIEDHFARLNTALTRGAPIVKLGVIHPIESYWLHFGPNDQTIEFREQMETNFKNVTQWLLTGLMDFDFISESLLPSQKTGTASGGFKVGNMTYDAVLVPGCETIRQTTLDSLKAFKAQGGLVVFAGKLPLYVDAALSDEAHEFAKECTIVGMEKFEILEALKRCRTLDIQVLGSDADGPYPKPGARTDNLFYQLRQDGDCKWLFICNAFRPPNPDVPVSLHTRITIPGEYEVTLYDTLTGEIRPYAEPQYNNDSTILEHTFEYHDSLLLQLAPKQSGKVKPNININIGKSSQAENTLKLQNSIPVTLSEPNALLLDMAEYRLDSEHWWPREEILRIDNIIRARLGYPLRTADMAQPWAQSELRDEKHVLSLRFKIYADTPADNVELGLENLQNTKVYFNGKQLQTIGCGYFVDHCIQKIRLGYVPAGENELIIAIDYNSRTDVEYCYVLGDFGVKVDGDMARLTSPVCCLSFGDWTRQGLPFYGGNVTYNLETELKPGMLNIRCPMFRAPLLSVSLDGKDAGNIFISPYQLTVPIDKPGLHRIGLTAYGSRINLLGALHNCDCSTVYFGPDAWRSENDRWTYNYMFKEAGILIPPKIWQYPRDPLYMVLH